MGPFHRLRSDQEDHQRYQALLLLAAFAIGLCAPSHAQTVLSNASPVAVQDFNAMGGTLALPANWRMHASSTSPAWSAASTSVTQQASTGSPTAGGTYNWGTATSERAVGAMTSSSFASPNNLLGAYSNGGSSSIVSLNISYQAERYRVNTAAASIQFHWSADGSSWTAVTAGDVPAASFPTGASAYSFAPMNTIPISGVVINSLAIPPGAPFYLRWAINTTGSSSQGIGIDDVSVTAAFAPGGVAGFTSPSTSQTEGGTATIGVRMLAAPSSTVVVSVSDALSGTATNPADHSGPTPASLTFLANGTYPMTQNVSVATVDDAVVESNETVALSLAVVSGPGSLDNAAHTLTITDNDLTAITGCSSSQSPYMHNTVGNTTTTSLLTVGDQIGAYKMVGDPDGLGAFDNGNGTFTVLMNHELSTTQGITRAHGSIGSFVSKWVINKSTLCVQSGQDLIQSVRTWSGSSFVPGTTIFNRFCSADLPQQSALYNVNTGKGTLERIFLNGEEAGTEGRAFAHIVTGPNAGTTWQLPWLGRCNWENQLASPTTSDKTVVVGTDDATPGQVYVYIGTKQSTGTEIERAGLQNGHVYGVAVNGLATEVAGSYPAPNTPFSLIDLGDVHNLTGAQLNTNSNALNVTNFLRPEDGAWDPANPSDFYFNTTASFTGPSRMWRLRFTDPLQPELGGTITAVLDGTEGQKMLDNMTIDGSGHVLLQEDVGNQAHIGKVWRYDIATDALSTIAQHDPSRFITGGANFLTQNEESSGILDVSHILGAGRFLISQMAHYATNTELVEGGQLLLLSSAPIAAACVPPLPPVITGNMTICASDTLRLASTTTGTRVINHAWSGPGTFLSGAQLSAMSAVNASSGTYTVNVSNGCGANSASVSVSVLPILTVFADTDGDGYGDPAVGLTTCSPPPGYVSDNTDNCPTVFGRIGDPCNDGNSGTVNDMLNASCTCVGTPAMVSVSVRAFLEGPFDGASLMNDALRASGLIPLTEPYTALGYAHLGGGGGETIAPALLAVSGSNAVVDWLVLELRASASPFAVLATRSVLVQRDGDVVAIDGVSPVTFTSAPGNYHIAVRHRNHLGCMTAVSMALSSLPTAVDFTSGATATHGTAARKAIGSAQVLWAGNVDRNGLLKYTGSDNDRDPILSAIGGAVPTLTVNNQYRSEDVNLDGTVRYTGASNDRDPILLNIGGSVPTAVRAEQVP